MKIDLGEFFNLMNNNPVFPGDTLSHNSMDYLFKYGIATRDHEGNFIPTSLAGKIHNKLMESKMEIDIKIEISNKP